MKRKSFILAILSLGVLFASPIGSVAQSNDESAIKQRMIKRVADIDKLKSQALVGESNKGFLEQRGMLSREQTQTMNAENADRRALYSILAGRLGLTIAVVGQGRAADLREKSSSGVWIQEPNGTWRKK